jgi:3-oxoacyl-[acyl-carrier-protein] synthase II
MGAIVVTGAGVLTPLGDSPNVVLAALREGRTALAPSADLGGVALAVIADFEATKYTNVRGLRMYNRTTRMAICAAKLALTDAKIDPATYPSDDLGVLMASTYGHLDVLLEYDRSLVANGVQRTNGALMPFAIPSAPGAMVALAFGAKAFSMTLSDGGSSSLDALALGARWLAEGRAKACVVVSAFSPSPDVVRAASRAGITALGEASTAFVLERAEDAATRGAASRGTVRGMGATFATSPEGRATALERASRDALRSAGLSSEDVGLASEVTSAALGETFDVAGALQILIALASFDSKHARAVLVKATARDGSCSALVLSAPGSPGGDAS